MSGTKKVKLIFLSHYSAEKIIIGEYTKNKKIIQIRICFPIAQAQ